MKKLILPILALVLIPALYFGVIRAKASQRNRLPDGKRYFSSRTFEHYRTQHPSTPAPEKIYLDTHLWDALVTDYDARFNTEIDPNAQLTPHQFNTYLEIAYTSLDKKDFGGRLKDDGLTVSPHEHGNVPYVLFDFNNTCILRMPNVMRNRWPNITATRKRDVELVPEFAAYLDHTVAKGDKHLYINLTFRERRRERGRTNKLQELDRDPKYGGHLFIATFDKDSDFYWQRGAYAKSKDTKSFKRLFLSKMFDRSGNFYWPSALDKTQWKAQTWETLNQVHTTHFANKATLIQQERAQFIEIAHLLLMKQLIAELSPNVCNISCMYTIDRGASALALLYLDHQLDQNGTISATDAKRVCALLLEQPILFHNRSAHRSRLDRLKTTLQRW